MKKRNNSKLNLDKLTIAKLSDTNTIKGGAPLPYPVTSTIPDVCPTEKTFIERTGPARPTTPTNCLV